MADPRRSAKRARVSRTPGDTKPYSVDRDAAWQSDRIHSAYQPVQAPTPNIEAAIRARLDAEHEDAALTDERDTTTNLAAHRPLTDDERTDTLLDESAGDVT